MNFKIRTNSEAQDLRINVLSNGLQNIRIVVTDSDQNNTVLTDRWMPVNGNFWFQVMMPLCREYVTVELFNNDTGDDSSFKYLGYKKCHLERRMTDVDFSSFKLNEYIAFIQKFCYNAGALPTNDPYNDKSFYCSENINILTGKNNPNFFIKYLSCITDEEGNEVDTPARVAFDGSFMEVSKKHFIDYTVPGRIAVLLHEYSHPFINDNPDDEEEADMNGLFIYLALGYPRVEGGQAWCDVFEIADTQQNEIRLMKVEQFIKDFDRSKMVLW